jgi:hypothetical protein
MKTLLLLLLILVPCQVSYAQTETLSNADVVAMSKAGLPPDIVIQKIRTSNTKFDVTIAGLIELKNASVADQIIALMIERQTVRPPNTQLDNTPAFSESGSTPNATSGSTARGSLSVPGAAATGAFPLTKAQSLASARTIAFVKSSLQPSRQALEKELLKRPEFQALHLTIERYKDTADLYVEIGFVHFSWITHRYVYRIYDRRSGAVLAAGETTSWGSLAENLARNIAKSLKTVMTAAT